ncbi:stage II sporulation protein M [Ferruginibacter sp. HRS2-29]|uniref:stage II sporulation protein M n=1 Tax=Ferruginibacter sp. HRS2-29 TaxID=2487334 RepID=UPI0020CC799F|nr:stage II sporulation protein M [Ferruginibacter sp. HRS2-29]MCP9752494.1 stage II sporulation protein M [Ferruginibacter sp. HRS2-29]
MREAMFIKKNVEKWNKYQHEPAADPDETAERFTTLIDDLSYAKTFYPRSKVTRWLNGLAASIYQNVYQNKKEKYSRVFDFWKYELPFIFKKYHRIFLFTTVSFALFVLVGVIAANRNPGFITEILGPGYVRMTEKNIADGNPFGVYSNESAFSMFVRIAFNNIRVSFLTFIGGFTGGLCTMYLMWSNGLMLGTFQYMFFTFSHEMGMKSILVIWVHGTVEIASIVIAATSGFILANGMLFPGSYKRIESFRRGVKDAAKVLICLIPFFLLAAFLESYITRLMSQTYQSKVPKALPEWGSILILIGSFSLILFYFVIWPIYLNKKGYFIQKKGIVSRLNLTNE